MAVIASAELDFNVLNDTYVVSLTSPSAVIRADYDGSNPTLDTAFTKISVRVGVESVPVTAVISQKVPQSLEVSLVSNSDNTEWTLALTSVPFDVLDGVVLVSLTSDDGWSGEAQWGYSIIRDASMLDWIAEWNSNKTEIGSTYLITPKLFVGTRITNVAGDGSILGTLNGVYIGPSSTVNGNRSAGVYGYYTGNEIFHLNEDGGWIGGWTIGDNGIYTTDGNLKILSAGTIEARNASQDVLWGLYKNGSAVFAKGNVTMGSDGSASFSGTITSKNGTIGGWSIGKTTISNNKIGLDANSGTIGVSSGTIETSSVTIDGSSETVKDYYKTVTTKGGVMMYYKTTSNYGFVGYLPKSSGAVKVLSIGSENKIAGWNFDDSAIYIGTKSNTTSTYASDGITLGTNGLRGKQFYINSDGSVSFAGGKFSVGSGGSVKLGGWDLKANELSSRYAALVSDPSVQGLFLSRENISQESYYSYKEVVTDGGGIYAVADADSSELASYDENGTLMFKLSSYGVNKIAGWNFDGDSIYIGQKKNTASRFTDSIGDITIGTNGIRGYNWKLESDGSGDIAGGMIFWDEDANLYFDESVKLEFVNVNGLSGRMTNITSSGIYSGAISADQITAGTIDASRILSDTILSNGSHWQLNKDGSGYFAGGNIEWDVDGNLEVRRVSAVTGTIGDFLIDANGIYKSLIGDNSVIPTMSNLSNGIAIRKTWMQIGGENGGVYLGSPIARDIGSQSACVHIDNSLPSFLNKVGIKVTISGDRTERTALLSEGKVVADSFVKIGSYNVIYRDEDFYTLSNGGVTHHFKYLDVSKSDLIIVRCIGTAYGANYGQVTLPDIDALNAQFKGGVDVMTVKFTVFLDPTSNPMRFYWYSNPAKTESEYVYMSGGESKTFIGWHESENFLNYKVI